jgi:hypothetical protein
MSSGIAGTKFALYMMTCAAFTGSGKESALEKESISNAELQIIFSFKFLAK